MTTPPPRVRGLRLPVPDNAARSLADIDKALEQLRARHHAYKKLERSYEGRPEAGDIYITPQGVAAIQPWVASFRYPLLHLCVDAVAGDLQVDSITGPTDTITGELDDLLNDLRADLEVWPVAVHFKSLYGESFIHSWPDETGVPVVWVETPFNMQALYNRGKLYCLARIWDGAEQGERRVNLMYADRVEKWVSGGKDPISGLTRKTGKWFPYIDAQDGVQSRTVTIEDGDDQVDDADLEQDAEEYEEAILDQDGYATPNWPLPVPIGRIPGVHLRTTVVNPVGEHWRGIEPWLALTKTWSATQVSNERVGAPSYMAVGQDIADPAVGFGTGSTVRPTVPSPGSQAARRAHQPTSVRVEPGTITQAPPGVTDLKRIGGEDPGPLLKNVDACILAVARVTTTAVTDLDPTSQVSGISRRESRARYTKKVEARQRLDGAAISDMAEVLCLQTGIALPEHTAPQVHWAAVERLDPTEEWLVAAQQIAAGVPEEKVLVEHGYPQDEVDQWAKDKAAKFAAAQAAAGPGAPGLATAVTPEEKQAQQDAKDQADAAKAQQVPAAA